jgi:hypothetical protein
MCSFPLPLPSLHLPAAATILKPSPTTDPFLLEQEMNEVAKAFSQSLRRRVRKQKTHTLPIMRPSNRLRQRWTDIHDPQLLASLNLLSQWDRIRNHHPTQLTLIQRLDRVPA